MTADKAEASAIVYSGPLNFQIGWPAAGGSGTYWQTLVAGDGLWFGPSWNTLFNWRLSPGTYTKGKSYWHSRHVFASGLGNLVFAAATHPGGSLPRFGNPLRLFGSGAVWGSAAAGTGLNVNTRVWWSTQTSGGGIRTFHRTRGDGNFSHKYALFQFNPGTGPLYGWIELSGFVSNVYGNSPNAGPAVTIEGWGYDTTGAQIHAGDTGVPEPGTFALTGLAALALGAAGMRRWRAAKAC
jgi:hypothetical protein